MISEFIYTGDFKDPFDEFFVEKLQGLQPFKLAGADKIPDFIGPDLALAVFKVGSHVNLLQSVESGSSKSGLVDKLVYYEICNIQCLNRTMGVGLT